MDKADYDANGPKVGALGEAGHDESLVEAKENSFSLREKADVQGCTSVAGGRMPGATRMRGYEIKQLSYFIPSPQPSPGGRGS